jgi:hypothetical protein
MRALIVTLITSLAASGCIEPAYVPPSATNVTVNATLSAASASYARSVSHDAWTPSGDGFQHAAHGHDDDGAELLSATPVVAADVAGRVLIMQSTHLDRPTEVVGVVDVHLPSGNEGAALAALRARAAALGADAVLGVEFHHGEEHEGPTHLSGLAVRFIELGGLPRY